MWSRQSASAKLRTTKFSSEGLGDNSTKFCTSQNFPLYGISMGRAIGGMEFVRCTEVVRLLESLLLEVSLYYDSLIVFDCYSGS